MRAADILVDGKLDEAISSADMTRLRKWVRESFANQNIKFDFSDHFMDRVDDRSDNLSTDDLARMFAQIITSDAIRQSFSKLADKSNIDQTKRVIDFKLDGKIGSIYIIKTGKNTYKAETFYYGGLLTQGARSNEEKYAMMNIIKSPQDQKKSVVYDLGEVPSDDLMTIIRRSREDNIPGENSNVFGMNSTQRLSHRKSNKVFTVINAHVSTLIDSLRKAKLDQSKGQLAEQISPLDSKITRLANELKTIVTLFKNNNLLSADESTVVNSEINKMLTGSPAQTTAISYKLKQTFGSIINRIRNQWNIDRDILRVGAYNIEHPNSIPSTANSEQILSFAKSNPNIANDPKISVSKFVKALSDDPSLTQNKTVIQSKKNYSNILAITKSIADQMGVTNRSISGKELSPTDQQGASTIDLDTGRLKSNSERRANIRASNYAYNKQLVQQLAAALPKYIDGLLRQPEIQDQDESEIRSLLRDSGTPEDLSVAVEMIADTLQSAASTPFNQMVKKYLPVLKKIATVKNTQSVKENTMQKTPISKYVNLLIADIANPKANQWNPEEDDISVDEFNKTYNPAFKIPQQYRLEAKKQAFGYIIDQVKRNPDMIDHILNSYIPWIPQSVHQDLIAILEELDILHAKLTDKTNAEKMKTKKFSESSKYLGPTTKVKINKAGWQIPLNKKGFGA